MDDELRVDSCDCKIGRKIEKYRLDDLNEELMSHRRENKSSLRHLAKYINHQILGKAIDDASEEFFDDSETLFGALDRSSAIATIYGALEDDDVAADRRARVQTRLEQAEVDLHEVRSDWVTHTTTRKHLQNCLDVDTSAKGDITQDDAIDTIEWISNRCGAIVGRTFERLQRAGKLDIVDLEVSVSVRITCAECGATYSPRKLISRGQCSCKD